MRDHLRASPYMKTQTAPISVSADGLLAQRRLRCVEIRNEEVLSDLCSDWQRIVKEMPAKAPLHDWHYLVSWWKVFGRQCPQTGRTGNLHVLTVVEGDLLVGILPFFAIVRPSISLLPKRLRPFGYAGRLEPYDLTEEPLVAILPGYESEVLNAAASWAQKGLDRGAWDCAILQWFGNTPRPSARGAQRFRKKVGPAHVALPETWDKFRKGLSKSMRDNLPYYGRLLTRKGHVWQAEMAEIGPDWNSAVSDLVRLHQLRACLSKDADRVDHLNELSHQDFLNAVHDAFRREARSFIGLLRVDGVVVAAQLYFEDDRTLVMSYSGFDLKWSSFSPLLVLQAEVIKKAIDRGIGRLDLLCGEAMWQERWQPRRDFPINKLTLASRRPLAILRCTNYVLLRELTIYWHKCRLSRWMKRSRLVAGVQSVGQAIYLDQARHAHLLMQVHRLRLHC
jgi:hypothetical protein